ncbi:MAG: competence/damage-inducible protein A [Anaerovoracaceae bacterium]
MRTAILSVGTEILFGQITNTNTVFLSQELNAMGIDVVYHYTVGDNESRLHDLIKLAFTDCDLVITTGGLGPTQDDLTKETIAKVMGDKLVLHEPSLESIKEAFNRMGKEMTENNIKQAYMPSKSTIFDNDRGTAPGFALEIHGKTAICLPGPPREMKNMFEKKVRPYLEAKSDSVIFYKIIRTYGIGESSLETELLDLINNQTDPTIATYAKEGESYLRVASKRKTKEEASKAVDEMIKQIDMRIPGHIYSTNGDDLDKVVCEKLIDRNISVACAESLTGGLLSGQFINHGGISKCFDRSYVTYSNQAKVEELNVSPKTLERFGAVSEETAREMVLGLYEKTKCDICISTTGIAGPDGGSEDKPVGLVYICAKFGDKIVCEELKLRNSGRAGIRNRTILAVMNLVNNLIEVDQ